MAKWRALHGDISTSEQVMDLTEFEQLLFTWMIPHADDWGIMTGKPKGVKAKAIPTSERSLEEIDEALDHIEGAGLIWRYEADGHGKLVQFKGWDGRQPIRKARRADGKYPDHAGQMPTKDRQMATNAGQVAANGRQMSAKTRLDYTRQTRQEKKKPDKSSQPSFPSEWLSILRELENLHDRQHVRRTFTQATGIARVTRAEVVIQVPQHDLAMIDRVYREKLGQAIGAACPEWGELEVILEGYE